MRFTYIKNSKANTLKRNSKDEKHQEETTVCFITLCKMKK